MTNLGAVALLHECRALVVVVVAVRDQHIFHVGRIEAHLLEAADDLVLDGVVVERVDEDGAGTGGERPGRVLFRAEEVEVVENLGRLRVPRGAVGNDTRSPATAAGAFGRDAGPYQHPLEV